MATTKTFDPTTVRYYVTAILSDGRLLHLENVAENIAWEENESELAMRLNLTLRDIEFEGSRLSKQLKLCTIMYLYAKWEGRSSRKELFRGIRRVQRPSLYARKDPVQKQEHQRHADGDAGHGEEKEGREVRRPS